jgi:hypothetical protein
MLEICLTTSRNFKKLHSGRPLQILGEIEGIKARGGKELKKYLDGGRLTPKQMILATCYSCMGGYTDGKLDCGIKECPLYPVMPYRDKP